jgi:hypothetical protein
MTNPYNEVVLTQLKEIAQKVLSGHALVNLRLESWKNDVADALVYQLSTYVLAEEVENRTKTVNFEYPKSWWQMFKQQYFPKWLLKRFPVKTKKDTRLVTFKKYATYPKAPAVAFPEGYGGKIVYKSFITEKKGGVLDEWRGEIM